MMANIAETTMRRILVLIPLFAGLVPACGPAQAATQEDFQTAFAAAQAADKEAAAHKNRWTTTEKALTDAKKAAQAGQFDEAVALAKEAEALAKASVEQSRREDTDWKNAVIR